MAFSGKMDERCHAVFAQQLLDKRCVANVADDEFGLLDIGNGRTVAGISQAIEDDERVVRMLLAPMANEVAANEAGTAGNKQVSQEPFPRSTWSWDGFASRNDSHSVVRGLPILRAPSKTPAVQAMAWLTIGQVQDGISPRSDDVCRSTWVAHLLSFRARSRTHLPWPKLLRLPGVRIPMMPGAADKVGRGASGMMPYIGTGIAFHATLRSSCDYASRARAKCDRPCRIVARPRPLRT